MLICIYCLYLHRKENGEFEPLDLTPYSSPPDLPDVMKSQETNGQEQVCTHLLARESHKPLVIKA